jgi:hypothetical protein
LNAIKPRRLWYLARVVARRAGRVVVLTRLGAVLIIFSFLTTVAHPLALIVALFAVWTAVLFPLIRSRRREADAHPSAIKLRLTLGVLTSVVLIVTALLTQQLYQADLLAVTIREQWLPWMDVNMPNDGAILVDEVSNLRQAWQDPPRAGLVNGIHFSWRFIEPSILQNGPQDLVEQGIVYLAMSDADQQRLFTLPAMRAFVNQFTKVKVITALANQSGPKVYFYRVRQPATQTRVAFGDQVMLVGYDLSAARFAPGETVHLRPYWRIIGPPRANYSMFVHLNRQGQAQQIAQYDGAPTTPHRPTLAWDDADELYIGADTAIPIPDSASPGIYALTVGIYDYTTGQRLHTAEGLDAFSVTIEVGLSSIVM